jgi:3-hydroxypropanoate dehydrogenase
VIGDPAIDTLFRDARTHRAWQDKDVGDAILRAIYDLARLGPTEANTNPMRIAFVKSKAAKERLKPLLDAGNVEKTMTAPVTAIIGYDEEFYRHMPALFPHATDAKSWFEGKDNTVVMLRSAALGGAYVMIAARALGLDCGPMSGFDADGATREFFAGTRIKAYFLINIGYGDASKLKPRLPRLGFDDACRIL